MGCTVYTVVPLVLMLGFAGVYANWSAQEQRKAEFRQEQRRLAREQAIQTLLDRASGGEYLKRDGQKEAKADLASGNPKLKPYGKQGAHWKEQTAVFKSRFGVTVEAIAGCIVSEPLTIYADDYNEEIGRSISERFGPNALAEADREAWAMYRANRATSDHAESD